MPCCSGEGCRNHKQPSRRPFASCTPHKPPRHKKSPGNCPPDGEPRDARRVVAESIFSGCGRTAIPIQRDPGRDGDRYNHQRLIRRVRWNITSAIAALRIASCRLVVPAVHGSGLYRRWLHWALQRRRSAGWLPVEHADRSFRTDNQRSAEFDRSVRLITWVGSPGLVYFALRPRFALPRASAVGRVELRETHHDSVGWWVS